MLTDQWPSPGVTYAQERCTQVMVSISLSRLVNKGSRLSSRACLLDDNTIQNFLSEIYWFASVSDCFLNFLAERTHLGDGRDSSDASLQQEMQTNAAKT